MAELKYYCPECKATLKTSAPIPAGKKVMCPRCAAVFEPREGGTGLAAEEVYKVEAVADEDEKAAKQKRQEALGPLKDRQPKSARGPALAICQTPSNRLLFTASFLCGSCIFSVVVLLWPIVFSEDPPTGDDFTQQLWLILATVGAFLYFGLIVYGAVRMQNIESLGWAITGSVLMLVPTSYLASVPALYWLLLVAQAIDALMKGGEEAGRLLRTQSQVFMLFLAVCWLVFTGLSCLTTLRQERVRAGFREKPSTD